MTSASSHTCHSGLPLCRSNDASTCVAVGGFAFCDDAVAPAGYDVNTRPFATAGALVCGSPRNHAHFTAPVCASTANVVHDSVLNTQTPCSHALADGPSSLSANANPPAPVFAS